MILYSLPNFQHIRHLFKFAFPSRAVAFHPQGSWIVAINEYGFTSSYISTLELHFTNVLDDRRSLKGIAHEYLIKAIAFHPDGNILVLVIDEIIH